MNNIKKLVTLKESDIFSLRKFNLELSDFLQFEERIKCNCIFKCRCKENPLYSSVKSIFKEINIILLKYSENKSTEINNLTKSFNSLLKKRNKISLSFITNDSLDFISKFVESSKV